MRDLKNLYSISSDTMNASNAPTYLDAGIHRNVELKEIKRGVAKNGSNFLTITIANEKGDKVSYTEFPLKFKKELSEMDPEELTNSLKRIEYQMARWKQIAEVFKPNCNLLGETFSEFIDNIIAFIGDSYKGVKLRIKVIYDDRNFTTLDSNPKATFIENMDKVPEELTKIRILPSDKLKRTKADDEKKENNVVDSLVEDTNDTSVDENKDNLPF